MGAPLILYMVELELVDVSDASEWVAWHDKHVQKLAAVPGIRSAQRFQCRSSESLAYLAIYRLDGADVLTSEAYRAAGGPSSAAIWHARLKNWRRNIVEGEQSLPKLEIGNCIQVVDRLGTTAAPMPADCLIFRPIGLDRSIHERGIRFAESNAALDDGAGIVARSYEAISPAYSGTP